MTRGHERHLGFFDVHVPHNIDFTLVLAYVRDYRPTHIIIGGDFLNGDWVSHWNEPVFKEIGFGVLRRNTNQEFAAGRDLLARIRGAASEAEVIYIPGNHEAHYYWASQFHPQLGFMPPRDMTNVNFKADLAAVGNQATADLLTKHMKLERLKIRVLPYYEELHLGHITYVHGHQFKSVNAPARSHPARNVVFGHLHSFDTRTMPDNGDGQVCEHVLVPCMTPLGPQKPGYLTNKSTRWLNGFWRADVLPNLLYRGYVEKILGGDVLVGSPHGDAHREQEQP